MSSSLFIMFFILFVVFVLFSSSVLADIPNGQIVLFRKDFYTVYNNTKYPQIDCSGWKCSDIGDATCQYIDVTWNCEFDTKSDVDYYNVVCLNRSDAQTCYVQCSLKPSSGQIMEITVIVFACVSFVVASLLVLYAIHKERMRLWLSKFCANPPVVPVINQNENNEEEDV